VCGNQAKTYTRVFKLDAVKLPQDGRVPAADLARELVIQRNQSRLAWPIAQRRHEHHRERKLAI
jgi:hypothetical protein